MNDPRELPDVLCHPSKQDVLEALWRAWFAMFKKPPSRESLCVLLAQQTEECGWPGQKGLHCWNFGNGKHTKGDGRCWVYFRCNEKLNGVWRWFDPPPPHGLSDKEIPGYEACCFRAYKTIDEGATEHLGMLVKRFASAWPEVLEGDPSGFSKKLKALRYYTADEADWYDDQGKLHRGYTWGVVTLFNQFMRTKFDWSFTEAKPPEPKPEVTKLVQLISASDLLDEARADMTAEVSSNA